MSRFVPSPGFEDRAKREPEMRSMLRSRASKAAREAERIGRQVSTTYEATVEDTEDGVRIEARTDGINAASWIEWGTQKLPAQAPLRRGAEGAGLRMRPKK